MVLVLSFLAVPFSSEAQFNPEINYQGKLTDSSGMAVADGTYNMNFWLLSSSTAATSTALWVEARTGGNRVQVTNGLFSVMLGDVSSLASVDFNQTLYLGVEIGGTAGTPAWDGEMSPRKILGTVPSAFEASNAQTLDNLATTSFLRSDTIDTMEATSSSALLTLIQNGAGKILSLFSGVTEMFTILNNGNVGIATTTPAEKLTVIGNTYLGGGLALTGALKDSTSATGTLGMILKTTGTSTQWVATSTLGLGDGTFLGLTDTPSSYTANRLLFTNSGGTALTDSANLVFDGTNLGIGTSSPQTLLHIAGVGAGTSAIRLSNTWVTGQSWQLMAGIPSVSDTSFAIKNVDNNFNPLVITSAGLIGVGNSSPTVNLDIGSSTLGTSEIVQVRIGDFLLQSQQGASNGLSALTTRGSNGNFTVDGASGAAVYLSPFTTNNNFLAAGGGRVRVGDQNVANYRLDIGQAVGNGFFGISNVSAGDIFAVASSSNVGIGSSTPSHKLTVSGDTFINDKLYFNSTNTSSGLVFPGDNYLAHSSWKEMKDPTGILLPMYLYPADVYNNTSYNGVIDMKKRYHNVPLYVVLNPSNGTGGVTDGNYTAAIQRLKGAGATVLGYVASNYTASTTAEVKDEIDDWVTYYPDVDGIFIDEMTNTASTTAQAYYNELTRHVHSKGLYPSIGNPGAGTVGEYFASSSADVIVINETSSYPSEATLKGDYDNGYADFDYNKRAGLVYGISDLSTASTTLLKKYLGMIYVTDDTLPNPWDTVSPHLEELFEFLSAENKRFFTDLYVDGNIGIATTTPSEKLTVIGNTYLNGGLTLTGALKDSTSATGTAGMVLQTTGTSTRWVATSTLGISGGASTFLSLTDTPSSYTANRLIFTNSGATALTDSADLTFDGTNFGVGAQNGIAFGGTRYLYASSTNDSVTFGENAGASFKSSTIYNVAIGFEAGRYASSTDTDRNNLIGFQAGYNNVGAYNNLIGDGAGHNNTGWYNNIIGVDAGYHNAGSDNEMIGHGAGRNLQSTSSVIVGSEAYRGGAGSTAFQAINNTALGYRAGYSAQTGASNNILLGYQAADNLTTGANNIVIGYDVDIASTTRSNQLNIGNLIFGTGVDGTGTSLSSGNIGIGTTTPGSRFAIEKLTFTGAGVAGITQNIKSTNITASAVQYGNFGYLYASNTATTTIAGNMFKIEDNTTFGNTIRGFEVQTDRGINTLGENTALSGFARTFGVRGTTKGDAGGTYEPAGIFGETQGTTQGNAIRGYSSTITTASLLKLFQDSSTFTGTGLLMNFGNTGGSFSSTTASKFIDLQNAGTSMFTVGAYGKLTIGDGTTNNNAGIQVGYGGICVDNDGSCNASTTGRISAVSYHTGNSDLAETYFSNENLKTGEVVYVKGGLSVGRAGDNNKDKVIGVVSTKPGLLLGFDDTSLKAGEKSYPIALKGRVPVRLSNENGEIKAGDELMLSSVSGVVMKATSTGKIVGVALEDFDGSRAYSDTYINQFGDDLVDPVFEPINKDNDPRINDGCYFGGGNASGDEVCVPLVSTTTDGQIVEAEALARREAEERALARLANIAGDNVTLANGQQVKVGQIIMFVDLRNRTLDEIGTEMISALMMQASSTDNNEEVETVWQRLVNLANNFVDGVLSVFTLKADKVEVKDQLCVDGVCVTGDDLRKLLNENQTTNAENNSSNENNESSTSDDNQEIETNEENTEGEVTEENNLPIDTSEIIVEDPPPNSPEELIEDKITETTEVTEEIPEPQTETVVEEETIEENNEVETVENIPEPTP